MWRLATRLDNTAQDAATFSVYWCENIFFVIAITLKIPCLKVCAKINIFSTHLLWIAFGYCMEIDDPNPHSFTQFSLNDSWSLNLGCYQAKYFKSIMCNKLVSYMYCNFQNTLLVEIRTLVAWFKSTLFLKMKCGDTHIYMKTECLQTKWDASATLFWVR